MKEVLLQALCVLMVITRVSSMPLHELNNQTKCSDLLAGKNENAAIMLDPITAEIEYAENPTRDILYGCFQLLRQTLKNVSADAIKRDTSARGHGYYHVIAPLINTLARRMGSIVFNLAMETLEIDARGDSMEKWMAVSNLLRRFGAHQSIWALTNAQKTTKVGVVRDSMTKRTQADLPMDRDLYWKIRSDWWAALDFLDFKRRSPKKVKFQI